MIDPLNAHAFAKVNLALAVYRGSADGYHPLRGIFQSISLHDTVVVTPADDDMITVSNDEAPADESNLAWRALETMRRASRIPTPMHLDVQKRIPSGAGLGGGSADAAAVIGLFRDTFHLDHEDASAFAASLGSDVPFALTGGTAIVRGRGEVVEPASPLEGFALAVVVPPFGLPTPAVFRRWDELDGPEGPSIADASLPPALRGREPMRNDLFPAAVSLDPRVGEWADELSGLWGVPVAMSGSGSSLFAYFASREEADEAARSVSMPTRLAVGVDLAASGWRRVDG